MTSDSGAWHDARIVRPFDENCAKFSPNLFTNSKYTLLSFLPRNLIEQFSYPLNVYFLLVSLLQFFSVISPVHPLSTLLPLVFAFSLSAIKEAVDDYKRHKEDKIFNNRCYTSIDRDLRETIVKSKDIQVGNIIRIHCHQEIPCDMVLLASSMNNGMCQIQTDKIDGETRLKGREVESRFHDVFHDRTRLFGSFDDIRVTCPSSTYQLHDFEGIISFEKTDYFISERQFLSQASSLKATEWIYGLVVYTGRDTQCFRNKRAPSLKRARIDYTINQYSIGIFCVQLCVVIAFGVTGSYIDILCSSNSEQEKLWYSWLITPARFFLLMAIMIPISFKVVIDVSKYITSRFISWDSLMRTSEDGNHASVSNTSIAEDLACVKYVMTDKTGTLTENRMEFRGFCLPGMCLGLDSNGNLTDFKEEVKKHQVVDQPEGVFDLLEHMVLCHSVFTPTPDEQADAEKSLIGETSMFEFASPEEECIIRACSEFGFLLIERSRNGSCSIKTPRGRRRYTILEEFTFTSERRRMSILLYDERRKQRFLLMKGAEEEIFRRLTNPEASRCIADPIVKFSSNALRMLAMSKRLVSEDDYNHFIAVKNSPRSSLHARQEHLCALWNEMEKSFELIGACAIGDNLQLGVAESIETLQEGAHIRFWMLTGDKHQTAVEVAKLCNILRTGQRHFHIQSVPCIEHSIQCISEALDESARADVIVMIVQGGSVLESLLTVHSCKFASVAMRVQSLVIYRITAAQKAMVTRLVKKNTPKHLVTLAIGDGGNDVAMIQAADVGIGIKGREGSYASRAADFSIARFRDLTRLLLVHGHYCHRRTSYIILYSFYKSMFVSFAQLVFNPLVHLRGVSFWDSMQLTMWNGLHTMPIVFAAIFDRDFPQDGLLANPKLYHAIRDGHWFNISTFLGFLLRGQLHAFVLILGTVWIFGEDLEVSLLNSVAYGIALLLQVVTMIFDAQTFTIMHCLAAVGTVFMYVITTAFHGYFVPSFSPSRFFDLLDDGRAYALLSLVILPILWAYSMMRLWANKSTRALR